MIWKHTPTEALLNESMKGTMVEHLDIQITEIGPDYINATMPIQAKSKQPMGLLHGGASAALSESIGSIAAFLTIEDHSKEYIVGIELNANHLKSAKSGLVHSKTFPVRVGRKIQVWNTDIYDDHGNHLCTSRLTTMKVQTRAV